MMFRQVGEFLQKGLQDSSFKVLMPTSKERHVQWLGEKTTAWFDVDIDGILGNCDVAGIEESCKQIEALVIQLKKQGIVKVIVGGFSQGGVIAASYPLMTDEQVDGVFSLSAYLPDIPKKVLPQKMPAFMSVGLQDELITENLFNDSLSEMTRLGFEVNKKEYPNLKHEISSSELSDLMKWVRKVVSA